MPKTAKPITDIACLIRVIEDTPRVALDQAIALAQANGAHLGITIAAQKVAAPYSPIGASFAATMIADVNKATETKAQAVAKLAREEAEKAGVSAEVRVVLDHVDQVAGKSMRGARAADVIVVDQPSAVLDTKGILLEEALFRSGRPVLVASPAKPPCAAPRRLLVAWDGSSHAARAAGDALALFPAVEVVEIVSVVGEKDLSGVLPGAEFAHHLARKGVETILTDLVTEGASVGAMLDEHAVKTGADMLVMGGFGHSRWREFLFGGVTVELTETARVPLLMAY